MERNIKNIGRINFVILLLAGSISVILARYCHSLSGQVAAVFFKIGTLVALISYLQARLEEKEQNEKLEFDEIAREKNAASLFSTEAETFPARRSREQFERFFLPGYTVLLFILELGGAIFLWRWLDNAIVERPRQPFVALALYSVLALVLFLLGKYSANIARFEKERLLRPGASFLVLGAYLFATRGSDAKRVRLQKRLADALLHSANTEDVDVILARSELMSEIPWVNRILINIQTALHLKRVLDQADLHITPSRLIMFSGMAGILAAMAVSALTFSILLMLVAGLVAAALPFLHVWYKRKKRLDAFLEHLPDALDLMSRALSAGHAFSEALHMISVEMPEPIASEFRKTYEEQNLGLSMKLALENLTNRIPLLDLRMCVTAILIQRETGIPENIMRREGVICRSAWSRTRLRCNAV